MPDADPSARLRPGSVGLLVGLGLLLTLPSFAVRPFHGEESRRAIPAREMRASGDWLMPTIWGQPYLHKPPAHFWLIAATAAATGRVDEVSTRLPSIASTVATGVAVAAFGAAAFGEAAGLAAGLLFLLGLNVLGKATVGEIEPPFALCVFADVALLWAGRDGDRRALVGSGLALAAALLLKGPPALLFHAGAVLGIGFGAGRRRFLRGPGVWLPLAIGAVPIAVWIALLLPRIAGGDTFAVWFDEVAQTGPNAHPGRYWSDRIDLVGNTLGAFVPSSLLCLLAVRTEAGRRVWRHPVTRFAAWTAGVAFAYLLVAPAARPRYFYPATPLACLVAGAIACEGLRGHDAALRRRLAVVLAAALGAAGAAGLAGFALLVRPLAGLDHLGVPGAAVLLGLVAAGAAGLHGLRAGRPQRAAACALVAIGLLRLFRLVEVVPQQLGAREVVAQMAAIERVLPPGAPVGLQVDGMWNELIYLERRLRWIDAPEQLEAGDLLLLDRRARRRFERGGVAFEDLHSEEIRGHRTLSAVRVAAVPGSPRSVP